MHAMKQRSRYIEIGLCRRPEIFRSSGQNIFGNFIGQIIFFFDIFYIENEFVEIFFECRMKNKISMPVELLIPLLAQSHISVNLGITLISVFVACNEFHTFLFQKIFGIDIIFQKVIHLIFQ